jgi:hypothetical protein
MADLLHPGDESPDETPAGTPLEDGEFVLADTANDEFEAELMQRACEEAGIPLIVEDPRDGMVGKLIEPVNSFRLLVPQADLERAKEVLRICREVLEADPDQAARAAEEAEEEEESPPKPE